MLTRIQFTKMQGSGNDFVILDNISQNIRIDNNLMRKISDRHFGVGCDQVLVVEPPNDPTCDFTYRIFNADGNEVGQCGNGARCFGRYVFEKGLTDKKELTVGTMSGKIIVDISDISYVRVDMGYPQFQARSIPIDPKLLTKLPILGRYKIQLHGHYRDVSILSMGNPHCIIGVPSTNEAQVEEIGKILQNHPAFPEGVNVTFMQVFARNHIRCRVYERGVGETLSCGTAACAAVVAGILQKELNTRVKVDMSGGNLTVDWEEGKNVFLSGPTQSVFQGEFALTPNNEE